MPTPKEMRERNEQSESEYKKRLLKCNKKQLIEAVMRYRKIAFLNGQAYYKSQEVKRLGVEELEKMFREIMRWEWFNRGLDIDAWNDLAKRLAQAIVSAQEEK